MIRPVINWPGLDFVDEMAEFKRIGKIVPVGIVTMSLLAPSVSVASESANQVETAN
jgi:hypothetical protein